MIILRNSPIKTSFRDPLCGKNMENGIRLIVDQHGDRSLRTGSGRSGVWSFELRLYHCSYVASDAEVCPRGIWWVAPFSEWRQSRLLCKYRHISIHFRHWLSFSPHLSVSACLLLSTDWTKLNPLTTYSGGAGPKNYLNWVVVNVSLIITAMYSDVKPTYLNLNVSMQKWISYLEVILHAIRAGNRGCG